jgi:hypothetical protein
MVKQPSSNRGEHDGHSRTREPLIVVFIRPPTTGARRRPYDTDNRAPEPTARQAAPVPIDLVDCQVIDRPNDRW